MGPCTTSSLPPSEILWILTTNHAEQLEVNSVFGDVAAVSVYREQWSVHENGWACRQENTQKDEMLHLGAPVSWLYLSFDF